MATQGVIEITDVEDGRLVCAIYGDAPAAMVKLTILELEDAAENADMVVKDPHDILCSRFHEINPRA